MQRAILSSGFFTLKQQIEYFEVGFRGSFISGLITAVITPLAIGVVERRIPVFGSTTPSDFDRIFVFLLAFGFWLGYACFIARAAFPQKDRIGWFATLGVGFLGGIVGRILFGMLHWPTHFGMGFVASLVGAFALLFAYHVWVGSQGSQSSQSSGPAA